MLNMTNSVATQVRSLDGSLMFDGAVRGICGAACRTASLRQVETFADCITQSGVDLRLVGTGGVFTAEHVRQYLTAGAETVQLATAAMLNPRRGRRDSPSVGIELGFSDQ